MKTLLIMIGLSSFTLAFDAYKYNQDTTICFYNVTTSNNVVTSTYIQNGETKTLVADISWYQANTTEAYYYNGVCNDNPSNFENESLDSDWLRLGMTESDYHFNMALMGNLLGFTLVFMVSFLFILQGRR